MTNPNKSSIELHQSNSPENNLTLIKDRKTEEASKFDFWVKFLERKKNKKQEMLHEKMEMDPVISLILFNEYIPLRQRPQPQKVDKVNLSNEKNDKEIISDMSPEALKLTDQFDGLFLGKQSEPDLRSEMFVDCEEIDLNSKSTTIASVISTAPAQGLFIRSQFDEKETETPKATGLFIRSESESNSSSTNVADGWVIA